jgi:hypothetical protein
MRRTYLIPRIIIKNKKKGNYSFNPVQLEDQQSNQYSLKQIFQFEDGRRVVEYGRGDVEGERGLNKLGR